MIIYFGRPARRIAETFYGPLTRVRVRRGRIFRYNIYYIQFGSMFLNLSVAG